MVILHEVNFKDVSSIQEYINSIEYWSYVTVNDKSHNVTDNDDPEIFKRAYKKNDCLEFHRFATEKNDEAWGGLRPRIELVPRVLLPKGQPIHINYVFKPVQDENFRGMVFQIMDHTNSGKTLPSYQFEIRYEKLHTRWCEIVNGNSEGTHIQSIAKIEWGKWYNLDVYAILSHKKDEGIFRVYLDGEFVWERREVTASEMGANPQIQYGIYAVGGYDLKTQIKRLMWETVDEIPNTLKLSDYELPTVEPEPVEPEPVEPEPVEPKVEIPIEEQKIFKYKGNKLVTISYTVDGDEIDIKKIICH